MAMNKPVAWMYKCLLSDNMEVDLEKPPAQYENSIPLYTHPVELTDEEILKLEEIEFENYCVDKESRGRKTATITDPEWAIWFARAILRKAQEK